MRLQFEEQLAILSHELISMGALCENAIAVAAKALLTGDVSLATDVAHLSAQIDEKERAIEGMCMRLLLRQQPVAQDLRAISAALKMITDMERIGDQAEDIAEIVTMANLTVAADMTDIRDMAAATIKMVTDSIDAYVKKDIALAEAVIAYDDVVDNGFDRVKALLIREFSKPETDGEYALDLLMIAKYFERIGDHATNIAEWVLFSITGKKEG